MIRMNRKLNDMCLQLFVEEKKHTLQIPVPLTYTDLLSKLNSFLIDPQTREYCLCYKIDSNNEMKILSNDDEVKKMLIVFNPKRESERCLFVKQKFPFLTNLILNGKIKQDAVIQKSSLESYSKFVTTCVGLFDEHQDTRYIKCEYMFNDTTYILNDDNDVKNMIDNLIAMEKAKRIIKLVIYNRGPIAILREKYPTWNVLPYTKGGEAKIFKLVRNNQCQIVRVLDEEIPLDVGIKEITNSLIQHENLVKFSDVEIIDNRLFYFMEYYEQGTLETLSKRQQVNSEIVKSIMIQLLRALDVLHKMNKVHCDLTPSNVFIKSIDGNQIHVLLGDYGRVLSLKSASEKIVSFRGTKFFASSEPTSEFLYTFHEDFCSLGATLFYLIAHGYPFDLDIPIRDMKNRREIMKERNIEQWLVDIIEEMLVDYKKLTVETLLHKFNV